jgi:cell division protein FtsB
VGARFATLVLLALLGIFHAQLWLGRGSVPQVAELRHQLGQQNQANEAAKLRNEQLANEVRDLQEGLDMVEEMARAELGMVKPNEIFVQVQQKAAR